MVAFDITEIERTGLKGECMKKGKVYPLALCVCAVLIVIGIALK